VATVDCRLAEVSFCPKDLALALHLFLEQDFPVVSQRRGKAWFAAQGVAQRLGFYRPADFAPRPPWCFGAEPIG
jgi:hypothetical protein